MTPAQLEFVEAVDTIIAAPKILVGADAPAWQRGRDDDERRIKLPLEIDGEQGGAFLIVSAFPERPIPGFSIGIMCFDKVICRLDFEPDVAHGNPPDEGLTPLVHGPHWHSWELNRLHVGPTRRFAKLRRAEPFTEAQKFDAALRWYCHRRNIEIGAHGIELPRREKLL